MEKLLILQNFRLLYKNESTKNELLSQLYSAEIELSKLKLGRCG